MQNPHYGWRDSRRKSSFFLFFFKKKHFEKLSVGPSVIGSISDEREAELQAGVSPR